MTDRNERARGAERLRRGVDLMLASAALLMLGPVMLLVSLAILAETGRPILFAQTRLGRGGRRFSMYKFRKFRPDPGAPGYPLTLRDDARMTPLGRILARTKLDELPQLFNILNGDMAVVGPRPESLAFAGCFTPELRQLLDHRPGIFGPSQAAFRSECDLYPAGVDPAEFYRRVLFPAKARLDLFYYPSRTLAGDAVWIVRTLRAVFRGAPERDPVGSAGRQAAQTERLRPAASTPAPGGLE
ncbi:MAG: sugar transferase [Pseudomonadota bacterium]